MPTSADPLSALVEISWPELTLMDVLADTALALGLGIAAAMLVSACAERLTHRSLTQKQQVEQVLASARTAPTDERALALVKVLGQITALKKNAPASLNTEKAQIWFDRTFKTDLFGSGLGCRLLGELYRPQPTLDLDAVEQKIRATWKRSR